MKNSTKSTFNIILQDALIDATPEQRDKINEVLKFATPAFCKKVDERYNARTYSDESISYNRIPTYNDPKGAALDSLDGTEAIIFVALCRGLIRGYYISSSKKELSAITGISRPTVGKAIDNLIKNGYIAVHTKPSGKRTQTIWMLNPLCVGNGKLLFKSVAETEYINLAGPDAMMRFYQKSRKWQAVGQTVDTGIEKLRYTVIMPYSDKKEEPSDAPTSNSSKPTNNTNEMIPLNDQTVKNCNYEDIPTSLEDERLPF